MQEILNTLVSIGTLSSVVKSPVGVVGHPIKISTNTI
jgi:hypothetical protein